ncbi:site-specific DNA-methyltransferase [Candidatus Kuenenbacteria bacterium]|nr:site-specific DNA-methyltransferase [Candidatus Kuenenbacteria bacterium]
MTRTSIIKISDNFDKSKHNNLICNDAFKVFSSIPNGFADHCITDPPYNISGYDFKKEIGWLKSNKYWSEQKNFNKIEESWDKFSNGDYEKFTKLWLDEIYRIVKPNGNIIIFGSYHNIYKIGYLLQRADRKIINSVVWYKRNAFPNITQRMLCESTEHIIWAVNETNKKAKNWTFNYNELKKYNTVKECSKCKKVIDSEYKFCPHCGNNIFHTKKLQLRNLWNIPSTPSGEKRHGKHPSQKPIEMLERLIVGGTKKDDIIIDPFAGSGTTAVVAKNLDRKFIAIDNNKEYCKIALNRLKDGHQQQII